MSIRRLPSMRIGVTGQPKDILRIRFALSRLPLLPLTTIVSFLSRLYRPSTITSKFSKPVSHISVPFSTTMTRLRLTNSLSRCLRAFNGTVAGAAGAGRVHAIVALPASTVPLSQNKDPLGSGRSPNPTPYAFLVLCPPLSRPLLAPPPHQHHRGPQLPAHTILHLGNH